MEELEIKVFFAVIVLILYILTAQYLENKRIHTFHESSVSIGLGALVGLLVYVMGKGRIEFSTGIFFDFVLPPIIFSAGYTLKSRRFFINIGFITLYGFLGTFISFSTLTLLGIFFNANGALDEPLSTREIMLLACVLSATDTVAAHSIVKESMYPRLNSILFGEGVINDAISIVLFRTVAGFSEFEVWDVPLLILNFFYTTVASILIGVGMGLLAAWVLKHMEGIDEHPDRETTLVILGGYTGYMVSELLGLSGIMTIFCCGVTMAHYAWYSLSKESQQGTRLVLVVISQGAEAFTFTYLGMSVLGISLENYKILFILCMFVAMVIGRAASIFVSSMIVYVLQCGYFGLASNNMCVGWFSGLIRGAVAFALVLQVTSPHKEVMMASTMGIAIFTTVILSALLGSFTSFVGLQKNQAEAYKDLIASGEDNLYSQHIKESGLTCFHRVWQQLDEKYLTKYFGGETKSNRAIWEQLWADEGTEINKL